MDKHTPTPWRVEQYTTLIWGGCNPDDTSARGMGVPVAKCHVIGVDDGEANAALICKAVNSHASLTEAVRVLTEALEFYRAGFVFTASKKRPGLTWHPTETLLDDCGNRATETLATVKELLK